MNIFLYFNGVNWNLFFSHVENFEVAVEPGVLGLVALALEFGVPVDLDAEVVARLLPVHLTASHAEQVLDTHLVSRRKLEQHHSSRHILGQEVEIKTGAFFAQFFNCQREKLNKTQN